MSQPQPNRMRRKTSPRRRPIRTSSTRHARTTVGASAPSKPAGWFRSREAGSAELRSALTSKRSRTVAKQLVSRVVQPGEWFLVLWGGTRKGSGTFYTRPQLAVPTVHRTLRRSPTTAPAAGDDAPLAEWTPKTPGSRFCP